MKKIALVILQVLIAVTVLTSCFLWRQSLIRDIAAYEEYGNYLDLTASVTKKPEMEINSLQDWFRFADRVNNGESFRDCVVALNTDLDFSGIAGMVPIGNQDAPFMGIFRGNGHALTNIELISDEKCVGVFGYVENAVIYRLHLAECKISTTSADATGGIAGYSGDGSIFACSFDGEINAKKGAAGSIVGVNWSRIWQCTSRGRICGSPGNSYSCYGTMRLGRRTGGIAGDNVGIIGKCINYASVFSVDEEQRNYDVSGGIAGTNYGEIESCTNFGSVVGAGIANSCEEYSSVRGCFNLGGVYAGIALSTEGEIDHCVNLGQTSGRYAADIVSWGGSSTDEYDWLVIRQCFYAGTSSTGLIRSNYDDYGIIENNYRIQMPALENMEQLKAYLESGNCIKAFDFLARNEKQYRDSILCQLCVGVILIVLFVDGGRCGWKILKQYRVYRYAQKRMNEGRYQESYKMFEQIADYRDALLYAKRCFAAYLHECEANGVYEIGRYCGKPIPWQKIAQTADYDVLISKYALCAECVHPKVEAVAWEDTVLYGKLNDHYKKRWFSSVEEAFLDGEISLLAMSEAEKNFAFSEARTCQGLIRMPNVLSSEGNVYWWLRWDDSASNSKMPFVTSEGLISERGKNASADNIAVRPVIQIRKK